MHNCFFTFAGVAVTFVTNVELSQLIIIAVAVVLKHILLFCLNLLVLSFLFSFCSQKYESSTMEVVIYLEYNGDFYLRASSSNFDHVLWFEHNLVWW